MVPIFNRHPISPSVLFLENGWYTACHHLASHFKSKMWLKFKQEEPSSVQQGNWPTSWQKKKKKTEGEMVVCSNGTRGLSELPWKKLMGDRVIRPGLTWQTQSLFRRHFCDNHTCVMAKITTKKAWNGTGELLHEQILWHGASFTRAETTSGRWSQHP